MANVCDNQTDFNDAFHQAVKYNDKQSVKDMKGWVWLYIAIFLVFFVWAIILAMKAPKDQRTVHLVLALVFSPAYVLAYYVGLLRN